VIENRRRRRLARATQCRADPDGYTILLYSSSLSAQVVLHKTLPTIGARFRAGRLFGFSERAGRAPSKGWKSVADLVAAAQAARAR